MLLQNDSRRLGDVHYAGAMMDDAVSDGYRGWQHSSGWKAVQNAEWSCGASINPLDAGVTRISILRHRLHLTKHSAYWSRQAGCRRGSIVPDVRKTDFQPTNRQFSFTQSLVRCNQPRRYAPEKKIVVESDNAEKRGNRRVTRNHDCTADNFSLHRH